MLGLSLTSTVRALEQDREFCRALSNQDRDRLLETARRYGDALIAVSALQKQMSAWVLNKAENITPEQAAQMFYAQDDRWQAAFFNCMQAQITAWHNANPGSACAGVPAGEGQWWHVAQHLDDSGFETLAAMHEHAASARELDK